MSTQFVYSFREGSKELKDLLGGKGANLAEMMRIGIPVPPGFTITTEACKEFLALGVAPLELEIQITKALRELEDEMQKRLGDKKNPLLVSVRSGAKFSMPGMMETILNVGLNDESVQGLIKQTKNPRFAWDAYRRLIQMYGKTVLGIEGQKFATELDKAKKDQGVVDDHQLSVESLSKLVETFKNIVFQESGKNFPQDPREQMDQSMRAVFNSWNTYRNHGFWQYGGGLRYWCLLHAGPRNW